MILNEKYKQAKQTAEKFAGKTFRATKGLLKLYKERNKTWSAETPVGSVIGYRFDRVIFIASPQFVDLYGAHNYKVDNEAVLVVPFENRNDIKQTWSIYYQEFITDTKIIELNKVELSKLIEALEL